jgi:hypothetical protein
MALTMTRMGKTRRMKPNAPATMVDKQDEVKDANTNEDEEKEDTRRRRAATMKTLATTKMRWWKQRGQQEQHTTHTQPHEQLLVGWNVGGMMTRTTRRGQGTRRGMTMNHMRTPRTTTARTTKTKIKQGGRPTNGCGDDNENGATPTTTGTAHP